MPWCAYYPPSGDPPIVFSYEPPYVLQKIDGLWDTRSAPVTSRGPGQRGSTLRDVVVNERVISLSVMTMVEPSNMAAFWAARNALQKALTVEPVAFGTAPPLGLLRFYRDDPSLEPRECYAIPRESPQFSSEGVSWAQTDIEFLLPYPFPREITDRFFNVAGLGGFTFPVTMPAAGWEMPSFNISVDVTNGGDVRAPLLIRIYGDLTDPTLFNDSTGERLAYTGNIPVTSYLEINTEYGNKSAALVVIATGVRTNAMAGINHATSTFWSLRPGINTVRLGTAVNAGGYANMYWRQRFGGL